MSGKLMVNIGRRKFCLLALIGTGAAASGLLFLDPFSGRVEDRLILKLGANIYDSEFVVRLGEKYLQKFSEESSLDELQRLLFENWEITPERGVEEVFAEQVQLDFVNRNTVDIDGWILSRTELRFCGVLKLLEK